MILKPFIDQAFVANLAGCWIKKFASLKFHAVACDYSVLFQGIFCLCQEQIEYHLEEERLKSKEALKKAVEVLKMTEL